MEVTMTMHVLCSGDRCGYLDAEVGHLRRRCATLEGALQLARADLAAAQETTAAVMADNDRLRVAAQFHYDGFKQEFGEEAVR
jgi:hypothetical protein